MSKLNNREQSRFFSSKLNLFPGSAWCAFFVVAALLVSGDAVRAQQPETVKVVPLGGETELVVGKPVAGETSEETGKPSEHTQHYFVRLKAGELFRVEVVQDKTVSDKSLEVTIFDENGEAMIGSEASKTNIETVAAVAKFTRSYRIEVTCYEKARYKITLVERRRAVAADRTRIAARRAEAEARASQFKGLNTILDAALKNDFKGIGENDWAKNAIAKYREAARLRQAVGDRRERAEALRQLAAFYASLDDKPQALKYYRQALAAFRAVGDYRGQADTLDGLARFYSLNGDARQAISYYRQTAEAARTAGDRAREAQTLVSIGFVYLNARPADSQQALKNFNQALEIQRAVGDRREEARSLISIGDAQFGLNQPETALESYEKALVIARAIRDYALETLARGQAARIKNAKIN